MSPLRSACCERGQLLLLLLLVRHKGTPALRMIEFCSQKDRICSQQQEGLKIENEDSDLLVVRAGSCWSGTGGRLLSEG